MEIIRRAAFLALLHCLFSALVVVDWTTCDSFKSCVWCDGGTQKCHPLASCSISHLAVFHSWFHTVSLHHLSADVTYVTQSSSLPDVLELRKPPHILQLPGQSYRNTHARILADVYSVRQCRITFCHHKARKSRALWPSLISSLFCL